MKVIEEIRLANDLLVQVRDRSHPVAADTTRVAVEIVVPVPLRIEYFDSSEDFDLVKTVFGDPVNFTAVNERTFVRNDERDSVFAELLNNFKSDSIPYLGKPGFPSRFVRSKLDDVKKRPHRYRLRKVK
ncbi:MAG TPA: hypothetical protein ENN35_01925 [Deltaproteobacteria bacterium]|nr:hypothetical protein [Deltaproteobacteria bacterium]